MALAPFDAIILAGALEPVCLWVSGCLSYLIAPDKVHHTLATQRAR
jgi:hypothetical protein